jgi:hypothetical protein
LANPLQYWSGSGLEYSGLSPKTKNFMTPEQKKTNLKTGLILASIAVVFFVGFMAKMIFLSK